MSAEAPNPYARARRLERARRLVGVIDLIVVDLGIDPLLEAGRVIERLNRATSNDWAKLAARAELKSPPSDETIALVRTTYVDRARLAAERPATKYAVRFFAPGRGVYSKTFTDKAKADHFAAGVRLYGKPAKAVPVTP